MYGHTKGSRPKAGTDINSKRFHFIIWTRTCYNFKTQKKTKFLFNREYAKEAKAHKIISAVFLNVCYLQNFLYDNNDLIWKLVLHYFLKSILNRDIEAGYTILCTKIIIGMERLYQQLNFK